MKKTFAYIIGGISVSVGVIYYLLVYRKPLDKTGTSTVPYLGNSSSPINSNNTNNGGTSNTPIDTIIPEPEVVNIPFI